MDLAVPLGSSSAAIGTRRLQGRCRPGATDRGGLIEVDPCQSLYRQSPGMAESSRTAETLLIRREGDEIVFLNKCAITRMGHWISACPMDDNANCLPRWRCWGKKAPWREPTTATCRCWRPCGAFRARPGSWWPRWTRRRSMPRCASRPLATGTAILRDFPGGSLGRRPAVAPSRQPMAGTPIGRRTGASAHSRLHRPGGLGAGLARPARVRQSGSLSNARLRSEELIGKPGHAIWHDKKPDGTPYPPQECPICAALKSGESCCSDQEVFWRKNGTSFPVEYIATPSLEKDRPIALVLFFRDISERRQAESNQRLATKVLQVLNRDGDLKPVIAEVLRLIRDSLGCDAVGLRMRKGDDCPYYVQHGFSDDFVRQENSLCATGREMARSPATRRAGPSSNALAAWCFPAGPTPACLASPRAAASGPTCRRNCSPWPPEADPRTIPATTASRRLSIVCPCPLAIGTEIIGLLQLNDRREGRFTPELVRQLRRSRHEHRPGLQT